MIEIQFKRNIILLFLILNGALSATDKPPGLKLFEQAYELEKTDPQKSASLYRQAFKEGLDQKLQHAARWRMYYLYKSQDDFRNALLLLNSFGTGKQIDNVRESLHNQIAYYFGISPESAELYAQGIYLLEIKDKREKGIDKLLEAQSASSKNQKFRNEIIRILSGTGDSAAVGRIIQNSALTPVDEQITRADFFIKEKNWKQARSTIDILLSQESQLSDTQKYKILYLLATVEKNQGNSDASVIYYRMASRYEESSSFRGNALAAFNLYRIGEIHPAWGLLSGYALSEDYNVRLLQLILQVKVEADNKALQELNKMEYRLKRDNSFLAAEAVEILGKQKNDFR